MEWLRIGEVAKRTGLTHRTLRHYDDLGLLIPSGRSDGDYRLYSHDDISRLLQIQHLKSLGLSLDDIQRALDEPGFNAVELLERHAALVEARIAQEHDLLTRLRRLSAAANAGWDEVLEVIALTERLRHPDAAIRFRATLSGSASAPFDELVELVRSDPEPGVREAATWALAQHGPGAIGRLTEALAEGDQRARHALAHLLGKIRAEEGVPALVALLADPDEQVAAKAAFSLGQVGGSGAIEALAGALGDPRATVQQEVADALGRLPGVVGPMLEALRSPSPMVRAQAAEVLGMTEDPASAGPLTEALTDPDPQVRFAALLALGQLDSPSARKAIASQTNADDVRVRLLARRLAGS